MKIFLDINLKNWNNQIKRLSLPLTLGKGANYVNQFGAYRDTRDVWNL